MTVATLTLFDGLSAVAERIEAEGGPLQLFAIMHRADTIDRWDVVVSAPRFNPDRIEDYRRVIDRVQSMLPWDQYMRVSHVAILPPNSPMVTAILASSELEPGKLRALAEPIGGVDYDKGYLVRPRHCNHL